MKFTEFANKISGKLIYGRDPLFNYDIDKQLHYLHSLGKAKDDKQRSFFQYKCQMKLTSKLFKVVSNLLALPLIPIFYIKYHGKRKMVNSRGNDYDTVFFCKKIDRGFLPETIKHVNSCILYIENYSHGYLDDVSSRYLLSLWRSYPTSFYFILKNMIKIAMYNYVIQSYHVKQIIVCNEYSFTSSVLTRFCEIHDVKHINVMHGEKLLFIRDSYFRFHVCYVWDKAYIELFIKLYADQNQWKIYVPSCFKLSNNCEKNYDFKYYLGEESEEELIKICNIMKYLKNLGYKVTVRPHPIYSNNRWIKKYFDFDLVENGKTIQESLSESKAVISLYSTVLKQAYYNNITIIIDNITNPDKFFKLEELDYVILKNKHKKLSDILEGEVFHQDA